ncbi:MAG: LysE family transporter [Chloroflexi bacterium]|nr:LysE family transporter [Chloroflexota bacterium]
MDINLLLRGIIIGFSIAAPVGPIGVLCIRRTLAEGRLSGFVSGLGAATADAIYGCIAGFGLTFISDLLIGQQTRIQLIGGLFLCYLGIKTLLAQPSEQAAAAQGSGLLGAYGSILILTLTNPMTILAFVAIFAGLGIADTGGDYASALVLVLGVFVGSGLWWFLLSAIASVLRTKFDARALRWVNRVSGIIILVFGLVALLGLLFAQGDADGPQAQTSLVALADDSVGFARADGPRTFDFPADYGPHPNYQTEWWYYTGNLETADDRHFGYQLTFLRRGLVSHIERQERASDWAADQVYMAHFAFVDVADGQHRAFERFSRGAAGLAGTTAIPHHVWLEDWSVEETEPDVVWLHAAQGGLAIDLLLTDRKGPILQGDGGYSQKGPEPGNASYYYSKTRLDSSGTVKVGTVLYQVEGSSWMDHEFSTSALAPDQVGWDWFALQLDDGSELMVFQIRKTDGGVDAFSSGTLIAPDGNTRRLSHDDFEIDVGDTWRSSRSSATYPARWMVTVPVADLMLEIEPYLVDQELNVSYDYWEGAVRVRGERAGAVVSGSGYIEMTGYAGSMQGQF